MPITFVYQTSCCCPAGMCCAWTVPNGVTSVVFEIWGGGGGGGGSLAGMCDCCAKTGPGGGGGYAMRTISVTPGDTYTVCAGNGGMADSATTGGVFFGAPCSPGAYQQGCAGNTSFVLGTNLSNFCATGGCGGCSSFSINCYGVCGCQGNCGGQGYGGQINEPGDSGALFRTYQGTGSGTVSMGGQAGGPGGGRGGLNSGANYAQNYGYGGADNDQALHGQFPGGGGAGHGCSTQCCCFPCGSGRGGHGLVKITW